MTYEEAIQFLYGLQLFGANFGLETTRRLAALAGNPQEKLRFIHVAGTNGKGSTCAMLESIYRAAGLRTGLYTSPHLVSFRERMQVNRRFISEADVARFVTELQPLLGQFPADTHPTMFEVITVLALKFFAEQKCDLVIWETGMGGRLDATNIVTPLASVITNIAFDHTQWLGDTLKKIAAEKAGIIKPGVPVITAALEADVLEVLVQFAEKNNAPFVRVDPVHASRLTPHAPLFGEHQKTNADLALATVGALQNQIPVSAEAIRAGLDQVNWPGRLQMVERPNGGKILLDGAHNVAGAQVLRSALQDGALVSDPAGLVLILGVLADKDWRDMCEILAPLARKIFTVPVASARTTDSQALAEFFRAANSRAEVTVFPNISGALNASQEAPLTVVAGSLYLIGEALEVLGLAPVGASERGLNEWSGVAKS